MSTNAPGLYRHILCFAGAISTEVKIHMLFYSIYKLCSGYRRAEPTAYSVSLYTRMVHAAQLAPNVLVVGCNIMVELFFAA